MKVYGTTVLNSVGVAAVFSVASRFLQDGLTSCMAYIPKKFTIYFFLF